MRGDKGETSGEGRMRQTREGRRGVRGRSGGALTCRVVEGDASVTWSGMRRSETTHTCNQLSISSTVSSLLQTTLLPRRRSALPALTLFQLKGVSEYLEGFIARIDTPHLDKLRIMFFMDLIFDVPQLHRFTGRTRLLRPPHPAQLQFSGDAIRICLGSLPTCLELGIICEEPDWQLSSMT